MHKYTSTSRKRRGSGEVEGGSGTKAPTLQGHLSKIENVNNETVGWGGVGIKSLKRKLSRMQKSIGL